jgi:hypothetical protein
MDDVFFLPVSFKGQELQFEAKLEQRGYVYVLHVDVNGTAVIFERDEELNWRALLPQPQQDTVKPPPLDLLLAIGETIEELLK